MRSQLVNFKRFHFRSGNGLSVFFFNVVMSCCKTGTKKKTVERLSFVFLVVCAAHLCTLQLTFLVKM